MSDSKKWSTKMIAEGGIMIALATLLSYVKVYEAPQGGSITAGSMIPIMIFAIRWGVGPGIIVGGIYGVLQCILNPQVYHIAQFFLDYPLAFACLGFVGIFNFKREKYTTKDYIVLIIGILLSVGGRFICHLLSGVIFFAEYAGGQNPWIYSAGYQMSYLLPEFIISAVVMSILLKPLSKLRK